MKIDILLKKLIKYGFVFVLLVGTVGGCTILLSEALGVPAAKPAISATFFTYWLFTNKYRSFKGANTESLIIFLGVGAVFTYSTLARIIAQFNAGNIFLSQSNLFASLLFIQIYAIYLSMEIINLCVVVHAIQTLRERFTQPPNTHKPDTTITQ